MLWLMVGIVVGVGVFWAVQHSRREEVTVPWYSWVLGLLAVVFVVLGIEVFAGSMVESEAQAAWMGLAAFALPGLILGGLAWWLPSRSAAAVAAGPRSTEQERVSA